MKKCRVILSTLILTVVVLSGCATTNRADTMVKLLNVLPENSDIYLYFPVKENAFLASRIFQTFFPSISSGDREDLINRCVALYVAVKEDKATILVEGSFPSIGVNVALSEKNGWTKQKDSSLPGTDTYYMYKDLSYKIAFPTSSLCIISYDLHAVLTKYDLVVKNGIYDFNPLLFPPGSMADENLKAVDFYVDDSFDLFTSTFIGKLPIELPLGKMYGRFIALQDEKNVSKSHESLYDFYGYFILPDAKVAIPTASALKLLGRTMGYNLSITHQDTLMEISGISISTDTLAEFISSYIQFFGGRNGV